MNQSGFELYMLPDNSWRITRMLDLTTKIVYIPDVIDGHSVSMIGEDVFMDNRYVEEVYLPCTISRIEAYAFAGCTNLKTVHCAYKGIPIEICESAFEDCVNLQTLYLGNIVSIGKMAFYNCKALTQFPFSECSSVQTFGRMAFALSGIKNLCVFDNQRVSQNMFKNCKIEIISLQNELHCDTGFYKLLENAKVLVAPNSPLLDLIYFGIDVEESI